MPQCTAQAAEQHADLAHVGFAGAFAKVGMQGRTQAVFVCQDSLAETLERLPAVGYIGCNAIAEKSPLGIEKFLEIQG